MEPIIKKRQFCFNLVVMLHSEAKKRAIDLDISLTEYMIALLKYELKNKLFDGVDIQPFIDSSHQ